VSVGFRSRRRRVVESISVLLVGDLAFALELKPSFSFCRFAHTDSRIYLA